MQLSGSSPLRTGVAVPHTRAPLADLPRVRDLPVTLIRTLDATAHRLRERIAVGIRAEVGPFRGPHRPRLHRLIHESTDLAMEVYLGAAAGDHSGYTRVGEHFRGLGRAGATAGLSIEPVIDAIRVARDLFWEEVRPVVVRENMAGIVVADLGSGVASYLSYLEAQVKHGFAAERGVLDPQRTLLAALLRPHPADDVVARAAEAGRCLDEQTVVVTAQRNGVSPAGLVLPDRALTRVDGDRTVVVATAGDVVAVREALLRLGPEVVVAESWPIELHQAWHGFRWTRNALALARSGRLPYDGRVIDCAAHRTQLWREADRPLLEAISDDLLAPLLALKPHQRLMLGLTLERWLEFNESATCLGKALGVHPHTVYNRLRELRALYGDRLDNPDDRLALRACLGLVLRQWQAEYRQRRRTRQR